MATHPLFTPVKAASPDPTAHPAVEAAREMLDDCADALSLQADLLHAAAFCNQLPQAEALAFGLAATLRILHRDMARASDSMQEARS